MLLAFYLTEFVSAVTVMGQKTHEEPDRPAFPCRVCVPCDSSDSWLRL